MISHQRQHVASFLLFQVSVLFLFFSSFFYIVLFHREAIKPVTHEPDRSRPSSVKCVGHFGSVRAGGTQSNCSLEGKCDRASLPSTRRVRLPHPNRVGGGEGGRQMAAANERGEKAAAGRKAGGRVKVARGEMGVWERYSAKEVEGERAGE